MLELGVEPHVASATAATMQGTPVENLRWGDLTSVKLYTYLIDIIHECLKCKYGIFEINVSFPSLVRG